MILCLPIAVTHRGANHTLVADLCH